jgi:hypothetical protein
VLCGTGPQDGAPTAGFVNRFVSGHDGGSPGIAGVPNKLPLACWGGFMPGSEAFMPRERVPKKNIRGFQPLSILAPWLKKRLCKRALDLNNSAL